MTKVGVIPAAMGLQSIIKEKAHKNNDSCIRFLRKKQQDDVIKHDQDRLHRRGRGALCEEATFALNFER